MSEAERIDSLTAYTALGRSATQTAPAGDLSAADKQAEGWRRFVPSVALYVLVKGVGLITFLMYVQYALDHKYAWTVPTKVTNAWGILATWDGQWYEGVAQHGYHPTLIPNGVPGGIAPNSAVFFPLYPGLIRAVHEVTGLGYMGSGVFVSIVASLLAAAGIYSVGRLLAGEKAALIAVGLWAIVPTAGVEWAIYAESTLVAAAAWCIYFTLRGRWLTAGFMALLAGLARPTGFTIIGAYAVAVGVAVYQRRENWPRALIGVCVAPLGLVGYLLWVGWRMGDLRGYQVLERGAWNQYLDWGNSAVTGYLKTAMGQMSWGPWPQEDVIVLGVLTLLPILLILFARSRPPLVVAVYVVLGVFIAIGTHQIFGMIVRYLLPIFPLLYPVASGLRRLSWPVLVSCLMIAALASGWYAGYVPFALSVP